VLWPAQQFPGRRFIFPAGETIFPAGSSFSRPAQPHPGRRSLCPSTAASSALLEIFKES
jgi:hypothetical protein